MSGIYAVVVTHNRLEKLRHSVSCVASQELKAERIVVIDNASTDGTREWLDAEASNNPRLHSITNETNSGGAGGFHAGIKFAYESGADYVWLMDDDCYPEVSALSRLHEAFEALPETQAINPTFACSRVLWTDGNLCEMNNPVATWDWLRVFADTDPYVLVASCSFASVLIPRNLVNQCGYPLKEYFIWFDDVEYTSRLSKHGPGVCVLSSVTHHDLVVNRGVNYAFVDSENVWKYAYGMRNEGSWTLRNRGLLNWLLLVRLRFGQMRAHNVAPSLKLTILKSAISSLWFNPRVEMTAR